MCSTFYFFVTHSKAAKQLCMQQVKQSLWITCRIYNITIVVYFHIMQVLDTFNIVKTNIPFSYIALIPPNIPDKVDRITAHIAINADLFLVKMTRTLLEFLVRFSISTFFPVLSVPSILCVESNFSVTL